MQTEIYRQLCHMFGGSGVWDCLSRDGRCSTPAFLQVYDYSFWKAISNNGGNARYVELLAEDRRRREVYEIATEEKMISRKNELGLKKKDRFVSGKENRKHMETMQRNNITEA